MISLGIKCWNNYDAVVTEVRGKQPQKRSNIFPHACTQVQNYFYLKKKKSLIKQEIVGSKCQIHTLQSTEYLGLDPFFHYIQTRRKLSHN